MARLNLRKSTISTVTDADSDTGSESDNVPSLDEYREWWARQHEGTGSFDCSKQLPDRFKEPLRNSITSLISPDNDKGKRCLSHLKRLEESPFWKLSLLDAYGFLGPRVLTVRGFLPELRQLETHAEDAPTIFRALQTVAAERREGILRSWAGATVAQKHEWTSYDVKAALEDLRLQEVEDEQGASRSADEAEAEGGRGHEQGASGSVGGAEAEARRRDGRQRHGRGDKGKKDAHKANKVHEDTHGANDRHRHRSMGTGMGSDDDEIEFGRRANRAQSFLSDRSSGCEDEAESGVAWRPSEAGESFLPNLDLDLDLPEPLNHNEDDAAGAAAAATAFSFSSVPSSPFRYRHRETTANNNDDDPEMAAKRTIDASAPPLPPAKKRRKSSTRQSLVIPLPAQATDADTSSNGGHNSATMDLWTELLNLAQTAVGTATATSTYSQHFDYLSNTPQANGHGYTAIIRPDENHAGTPSQWQLLHLDFTTNRASTYLPTNSRTAETNRAEHLLKSLDYRIAGHTFASDISRISIQPLDPVPDDNARHAHSLVAAVAAMLCIDPKLSSTPSQLTPRLWEFVLYSLEQYSRAPPEDPPFDLDEMFNLNSATECERRGREQAAASFTPSDDALPALQDLQQALFVVQEVASDFDNAQDQVMLLTDEAQAARQLLKQASTAASSTTTSATRLAALVQSLEAMEKGYEVLEAAQWPPGTSREQYSKSVEDRRREIREVRDANKNSNNSLSIAAKRLDRTMCTIIADFGATKIEYAHAKKKLVEQVHFTIAACQI
ncbi:hypothetical protein AC578_5737 [Pseudocercospora eumusae]|uniref:Uncharacterized protein n=1 Tax=Pseudocercospora eumusae TaxID=321146 RepID=A0A139H538_9PEZI|nr:hypothetical protein AC578_5737 [Pseudocercospora eumusae]